MNTALETKIKNNKFNNRRQGFASLGIFVLAIFLWGFDDYHQPFPINIRPPVPHEAMVYGATTQFGLTFLPDIIFAIPELLISVNKENSIADYAPTDLVDLKNLDAPGKYIRKIAYDSLEKLVSDMRAAGRPVKIISAYRNYSTQKSLFSSYERTYGNEAHRFSAQAGHSEHQLGTTIDFGTGNSKIDLTAKFAFSPQGIWLSAHAAEYGFVESYPPDKEDITGYIYEPWHYRFIGIEGASNWKESGLTLKEFLEIQAEGK
ncbi:D-alanyl-D-alanine carboxypeptidase family protein [bacterium]|nr:MAG: D-alanyl-D-alanine carboxypeptidase family protein [bacterium]